MAGGVLLGLSFPPFHLEWLAFVALIPILFAIEEARNYREVLKLSYYGFLVFNVISLYWVGGWSKETDPFMMIGGAALVVGHPLFFAVPVLFYFFVRKRIGKYAILLFPFIFVSFEHIHSITQVAFPWLTLGYSQCYNLPGIQFASITGLFGISLQILIVNSLLAMSIMKWLEGNKSSRSKSIISASVAFLFVVVPEAYGVFVLSRSHGSNHTGKIRVTIVQPNIDPYAKWEGSPTEILRKYEMETYNALHHQADLVVWPETAIPFYILLPQFNYYRAELQTFVDTTGISLLSGLPLARYYMDSTEARPSSHYDEYRHLYYDAYNGAALFLPRSATYQTYGKIVLVPFAERLPYADRLPFLIKPLKWGVGISNWARGTDTTIFKLPGGTRFSTVICYESIFPGYVREFANKGATFLVIVTNDGWYGNTSGPYQHAAYAVMRAIENRRSVVRSANTGISEFIDPYGRYIGIPTKYGEIATLTENIPLDNSVTFYSKHGNWIAEICEIISGASILFGLFLKLKQRGRRRDSNELH
jgi:apolipoprotein N-acyltransferase